jgi:hypothetical protein
MQFSPTSCHFIHLSSKYSPQHPVLEHPQSHYFSNTVFSRNIVLESAQSLVETPNSPQTRTRSATAPLQGVETVQKLGHIWLLFCRISAILTFLPLKWLAGRIRRFYLLLRLLTPSNLWSLNFPSHISILKLVLFAKCN